MKNILILILLLTCTALSTPKYWQGDDNDSATCMSVPNNWDPPGAPDSTSEIICNSGSVNCSTDTDIRCSTATFTADYSGSFKQTNRFVTGNKFDWDGVGTLSMLDSTYQLSGGTFDVGNSGTITLTTAIWTLKGKTDFGIQKANTYVPTVNTCYDTVTWNGLEILFMGMDSDLLVDLVL